MQTGMHVRSVVGISLSFSGHYGFLVHLEALCADIFPVVFWCIQLFLLFELGAEKVEKSGLSLHLMFSSLWRSSLCCVGIVAKSAEQNWSA